MPQADSPFRTAGRPTGTATHNRSGRSAERISPACRRAKGYGLALAVDLIAGLLSGAAYLSHVKSWVDTPEEPQNLGHYFLLIDVGRLGTPDWLEARIRDFTTILHDTPPSDPNRPVLVPGEPEMQAFGVPDTTESISLPGLSPP